MSSMSVEEWVTLNYERVQKLWDEAMVKYMTDSARRKAKKNCNSQVRRFDVGQRVYYRTPRLSESLELSWQGLYIVVEALGGPS